MCGTWTIVPQAGRWAARGTGASLSSGEVSAPLVIIGEVALQVVVQRTLAPRDEVIEALASERTNYAFNERILPGAPRRRQHFVNPHLLHGRRGSDA